MANLASGGLSFGESGLGSTAPAARVDAGTHFPLVQTLRGVAALWVVLFHAAEGGHIATLLDAMPGWLAAGVFHAGHFGVSIFFALSGFVIAHSLRDVRLDGGLLGRFVLRRSLRLDPPYWAAMALVVALAAVSALVKHEPWAPPAWSTVALHTLYLQELFHAPQINVVFWTLAYEFQFYVFFAASLTLVSALAKRHEGSGAVVWAGLALLALANALGLTDSAIDGLFVHFWCAFFVGVLAYHGIDKPRAALAGAVLVLVMLLSESGFFRMSAATAAFLWIAARQGWAQRPPMWPVGQWLGLISYSLYLIHNSITGATAFLARRVVGSGLAADALVLVVVMGSSIAAAALFWWVFERPAHAWSRRIRLRR